MPLAWLARCRSSIQPADLLAGKLSILMPVGVALLGVREGQSMAWGTASERSRPSSFSMDLYQPEANGRLGL